MNQNTHRGNSQCRMNCTIHRMLNKLMLRPSEELGTIHQQIWACSHVEMLSSTQCHHCCAEQLRPPPKTKRHTRSFQSRSQFPSVPSRQTEGFLHPESLPSQEISVLDPWRVVYVFCEWVRPEKEGGNHMSVFFFPSVGLA